MSFMAYSLQSGRCFVAERCVVKSAQSKRDEDWRNGGRSSVRWRTLASLCWPAHRRLVADPDRLRRHQHLGNSRMYDPSPPAPHHIPKNIGDRFAYALVKFMRFFADTFFAHRYGHRAVVLETVAAVPGMVAGSLQHLRALRRMESDHGWIHTLLDEAENERMHL